MTLNIKFYLYELKLNQNNIPLISIPFTIWFFLFILHFIKVFITDRFMNKNWERDQIDRLVALQQKKIEELQSQINDGTPKQ